MTALTTGTGRHKAGSTTTGPTLAVRGRHHRTRRWARLLASRLWLWLLPVLYGLAAGGALVFAGFAGMCAVTGDAVVAVAFAAAAVCLTLALTAVVAAAFFNR